MRAAASSMRFDVLDRVIGLPGAPGLRGSGGGARSGSELSHLSTQGQRIHVPELEEEGIEHRHRASSRLGERMLVFYYARLGTVPRRISRARRVSGHGQCLCCGGCFSRNAVNQIRMCPMHIMVLKTPAQPSTSSKTEVWRHRGETKVIIQASM
jgi:hypothetical protein